MRPPTRTIPSRAAEEERREDPSVQCVAAELSGDLRQDRRHGERLEGDERDGQDEPDRRRPVARRPEARVDRGWSRRDGEA
jgi:hypothetical protein